MREFISKCLVVILLAVVLMNYQAMANARAAVIKVHEEEAQQAESLAAEYEAMVAAAESEAEEASRIYDDGTYQGTGAGFGGDITVSVNISEDKITEVTILSADGEDEAYLNEAKKVTDEILSEQSADVDKVSGATLSSTGILDACAAALEEAKR